MYLYFNDLVGRQAFTPELKIGGLELCGHVHNLYVIRSQHSLEPDSSEGLYVCM